MGNIKIYSWILLVIAVCIFVFPLGIWLTFSEMGTFRKVAVGILLALLLGGGLFISFCEHDQM